ncbi:HlyD family efflux transporter periplasmic adaptor subunit [Deltaproteobacteria bacterium OttesenSCG-928-K17]|nr:HlyD family efflux transporter periplasmic adaptor subunit [Deltaproteobacteria bacterium OttesenSCG-928-K17]
MLKNGLKITVFLVAVGLMAALGAPEKSSGIPENQAEVSQPVKALKVEALTVVPRHTAYGQTKPDRTWAAVARIGGEVAWVSPKLAKGEIVEAGEDLIKIDNKPFQRAVDRLKGEIKIMEAGFATDDAEARARRLNSLKTLLARAEENLEAASVKAPFKGRVDEVHIAAGQALTAGATMMTLESTAKGEITIALSPEKVAMITGRSGSARADSLVEASVTVEAEDETLSARPRSAAMNPSTGLVEASVVLEDPPPSGTMCKVTISGRPQAGQVVIPRQAVRDGEVLLVDARSQLTRRPVTVKYMLDQYAVIDKGLLPGETLVLSDPAKLADSRKLEVRLDGEFYLAAKTELNPEAGPGFIKSAG